MVIYDNKVILNNGRWIEYSNPVDPHNPLKLPPYTIRLKFSNGTPIFNKGTGTLVDAEENIWDLTYENSDWSEILRTHSDLLEVLGANIIGVVYATQMFEYCTSLTTVRWFDTSSIVNMRFMFGSCMSLTSVPLFDTSKVYNMSWMFQHCMALTNVPLFDTSNVYNMEGMFYNCNSLTTIPLLDTSKVTNMYRMFYGCSHLTTVPLLDTSNVYNMDSMFYNSYYVQSGALALYQQASTQDYPPINHDGTFTNCGSNTQTGAAELAQIPDDWK